MDRSLLAVPGALLAALTDYPMEWFDPERVANHERDHGRRDGQTWAVVRGTDRVWRVYAPGSPAPDMWPHGTNPWGDQPPAAIFAHERFPYDVDLSEAHLALLARMVGFVADGDPVEAIEGIRWDRPEDKVGHAIVYVRVA